MAQHHIEALVDTGASAIVAQAQHKRERNKRANTIWAKAHYRRKSSANTMRAQTHCRRTCNIGASKIQARAQLWHTSTSKAHIDTGASATAAHNTGVSVIHLQAQYTSKNLHVQHRREQNAGASTIMAH